MSQSTVYQILFLHEDLRIGYQYISNVSTTLLFFFPGEGQSERQLTRQNILYIEQRMAWFGSDADGLQVVSLMPVGPI